MADADEDDDRAPDGLTRGTEQWSKMMAPPKFIRDIQRLNEMMAPPKFVRELERLTAMTSLPKVGSPSSSLSSLVRAATPLTDAIRAGQTLGGQNLMLDVAKIGAALSPFGDLHRMLLGLSAGVVTPEFKPIGEVDEDEPVILTPEQVFEGWAPPPDTKSVLVKAGSVPLSVIQELLRQPKSFFKLGHRQFEWVVAEILAHRGFENIIVTPRSGDGGKDIIATYDAGGVPVVMYFECKHHGEGYPVDIVDLRALLGVVGGRTSRALKGVLVTTGRFTEVGRKYIASEAQLGGEDYDDLAFWTQQLKLF